MTTDYQTRLEQVFGFREFRPGQREVLKALDETDAALAVFPTGGGKSLCYQLPALDLPGLTLVVSPLIALMKDQITYLNSRGVKAARLDSSLSLDDYRSVVDQINSGELKLLYAAPERFNNERFLQLMKRAQISLFAVDEAHCISEWGHNFRPDYLKLADIAKEVGAQKVLALTATATPKVVKDICAGFGISANSAVVTGFYRDNLVLCLTPVPSSDRDALLVKRLQLRKPGSSIVYVTLQKTAERVAAMLQAAGFEAKAYHAGMETEARSAVQEWWMEAPAGIVVATIAFGMGIDKAAVRYVYHYNLPGGLEAYSQEIGRAGRDGQKSTVELLACPDDLPTIENFAYGDTPTTEAIAALTQDIMSREEDFDLDLYSLSDTLDVRQLVLRTLLAYLELSGHIRQGTPYYSTYTVRLLADIPEITEAFPGEPGQFVTEVLQSGKSVIRKGAAARVVNPDTAAELLGQPRKRVVRSLEVLEQRGLVELSASDVRQRYRRTSDKPTRADIQAITASLVARFEAREAQAVAGPRKVLDLTVLDACQTYALAAHFGEKREGRCGHCTWCLNGQKSEMPAVRRPSPLPAGLNVLEFEALADQYPAALGLPRQRARFLCGLSSPAVSRARIMRNPMFGVWAERRFHDVLEWCESH